MTYFQTTDIMVAVGGLVKAIQTYIVVHNEIFGEYEGDLMPEPTPEVLIYDNYSHIIYIINTHTLWNFNLEYLKIEE